MQQAHGQHRKIPLLNEPSGAQFITKVPSDSVALHLSPSPLDMTAMVLIYRVKSDLGRGGEWLVLQKGCLHVKRIFKGLQMPYLGRRQEQEIDICMCSSASRFTDPLPFADYRDSRWPSRHSFLSLGAI